MPADELTAAAIARAALEDPSMAGPSLPRLRRGLATYPYRDGLVVDGLPRAKFLRGSAAATLLPRLLPLLDGRRDLGSLAAELALPVDTVRQAVSLLWSSGVVEEGPPPAVEPDPQAVGPCLADFLSRIGDATGANRRWEDAAVRALGARIEVFGSGPLAVRLTGELGAHLTARPGRPDGPADGTTLAVLVDGPGRRPVEVAGRCWRQGVPVLRIGLTAGRVHLGPWVDRDTTPCLDCLLATAGEAEESPGPGDADVGQDDVALAAALAAAEVFAAVTRTTRTPFPAGWRSVGLAEPAQQLHTGATRSGCPTCSVAAGPLVTASTAARYEASVALPPHRFLDPKAHQIHYRPSSLALQEGGPDWPGAPLVVLPDDADLTTGPATMRVAQLGELLRLVAGLRGRSGGRIRRWTPSGGNIGSVVAHVLAREVDGLPPGAYGYRAAGHQLARLPADGLVPPGHGAATVVLTADLARVARKYDAFGLRLSLLDAGCARHTAVALAGSLGLTVTAESDWDDAALAAVLDIDPEVEPITVVLTAERVP